MYVKSGKMLLLQVIVFLGIVFSNAVFAFEYPTEHFVISSDLDPCFVEYAGKKAELCYDALLSGYFERGWDQEPAVFVYYSDSQSESESLIRSAGVDPEAVENGYFAGGDCLYVFRSAGNGDVSEKMLFGGIASCFIEKNYKTELTWFKSELGQFLREGLVFANGEVKLTRPMIACCEELEGKIDQESIVDNMKKLLSSSLKNYESWDIAHPFTQAFLSWLYDKGLLGKYLLDVQSKGHRHKTLVGSTGIGYGEIKSELIKFINNYSQFQKNFKLFRQTDDFFEKEQFLEAAYGFIPDANVISMELAKLYYENDDYKPCLKKLEFLADDPANVNNWQALKMTANVYYRQKEYYKAAKYYERLWGISDDYAYKYRIAYQIANCYYYQGSKYSARRWYENFLQNKWHKSDMGKCEEYAKKFLKDDSAEYD